MSSGIFTIIIVLVSVFGGLLITGLSIFMFWKVFSGFSKSMQQNAQLLSTGQPAQGRIVSVRDVGGSIQIGAQVPQHRFQIDLDVTPYGGQPPYRVSTTQLISMMHIGRLQPGAMLEVRYDPMNPMRVALVL